MTGRVPAVVAGAVVVVVAAVLIASSAFDHHDHTLWVRFDEPVVQVNTGQDVRIAGRKIGEVADVQLQDGQARLKLKIRKKDVWPLPRGTVARVRWGSTSSYLMRYIELAPGPASAPPLPDGAQLTGAQALTSVDLDQMYRVFRGRTHADVGRLIGELSSTFGGRSAALRRGLADAPAGLEQTSGLLTSLDANDEALRTLAVAGDRTLGALAAHDAQLGQVMDEAAGTFDEFAAHTRSEQQALDRMAPTLANSRQTLGRLDTSLTGLDALMADLRPGAPALRRMAGPARVAFAELHRVAPLATATFRRGATAAPPLGQLLATGTDFLPRFADALQQARPVMGCLRPYGPEIAGFLSTWTGFSQEYDAQGHYARVFPLTADPAVLPGTMNNPATVVRLSPGFKYAMPRPPGLSVGQPWFQPQCGAGPDALDPTKDPEQQGAKR